jgi:hypothetical protein
MTSEEFFHNFTKGESDDSEDLIEWANDYQHYIVIWRETEAQLPNVA